jgi:hypothetical protein
MARALLRSLASRELSGDAVALASFFQSAQEANRAITDVISRAAGLPDPEIFFRPE